VANFIRCLYIPKNKSIERRAGWTPDKVWALLIREEFLPISEIEYQIPSRPAHTVITAQTKLFQVLRERREEISNIKGSVFRNYFSTVVYLS
jgi:hypothetical protein